MKNQILNEINKHVVLGFEEKLFFFWFKKKKNTYITLQLINWQFFASGEKFNHPDILPFATGRLI